jgi:hypothetical protein
MKNLLAILAIAIIGTASAFAVASTNTFTVTTTCPAITVTAKGFVGPSTSVVAGGADVAGPFVGTWDLANWGTGSLALAASATTPSVVSATTIHYTAVWDQSSDCSYDGTTFIYDYENDACNVTAKIFVRLTNVGAGAAMPAGTTNLNFVLTGSF